MYSHQLEQLARQRTAELQRQAGGSRARVSRRLPGNTIRNRTGWTLISIGLRIAESGNG
jgi:hypothetical protein